MFRGSPKYYDLIKESIGYFVTRRFEEQYNSHDWAFYVNVSTEQSTMELMLLLRYLQRVVFIDDALDYSFALDYYKVPYSEGGSGEDSAAGELIYDVKYCNKTERIADIVDWMADFFENVSVYSDADYLVSMPHRKSVPDIPQLIQKALCKRLNIADGNPFLAKIKETGTIKNIDDPLQKEQALRGAFAVREDHPFKGKRIVIIDDVYDHGITLHELATTLQNEGAIVASLVVAKTTSKRSY